MGVIRDYTGHGTGSKLHEDPLIPNYGRPGTGAKIMKNMTLAVEPMIALGTYECRVLANDWTVVTLDGRKAAHYENTILITDGEPEILTLL
jgi:methionyl aminopeptidase